ncbi:hypothetical protein H0W80_00080 [Candidatus Saccharibacteria bacterium]|nr:hypothetical protein [Candidatus Saccharibacteria bacterium]
MTIGEWYAQRAGQRLGSCGGGSQNIGQCQQLVQLYALEVLGVPGCPAFPVPYARLMMGTRTDYFTTVPNTPSGVPPYGSIVVFNGRVGGGYGHTGVAIEGSDTNVVRIIQQNDPMGSGASIKIYNYNNVMGWLVPKSQAVQPQGDNDVIINDNNNFARANKTHLQIRGRALDRGTFNAFVGKGWLTFIEALSDDQEANDHEAAATLGAVARRDNWQQQIYTLQDQNKVLQGQVDSLAKQVKELQAQIGTQTDDTKLLNGFGEILTKLIIRLGLKGEQK